jgi:hypothetical protein
MCRSPTASRSAIPAKEAMRPSRISSIHPRALAMTVSKASWLSGFIVGFVLGSWMMPFIAAKLGAVQGRAIMITGWRSGAESVSPGMRWDPSDPTARNVDYFVLSKGRAAPILWAALSEAHAIAEDPLSLRRIDSTLSRSSGLKEVLLRL